MLRNLMWMDKNDGITKKKIISEKPYKNPSDRLLYWDDWRDFLRLVTRQILTQELLGNWQMQ